MALIHVTHNDTGDYCSPQNDQEWKSWVSATATRNYILGDSVLDWLSLYGELNGFERDDKLDNYDERTDFTKFILAQGNAFEKAVLKLLQTQYEIHTVSRDRRDVRNEEKAKDTFHAMAAGIPIISQGILWNPENNTYGIPDLLIRSDILKELFPEAITHGDSITPATGLGNHQFHYRVVDIKFTTLNLLQSGELANSGNFPAYKAQLYLYNQAVGRIQGYEPRCAYLLGRGWRQGKEKRGYSCTEILAPVDVITSKIRDMPLSHIAPEATKWVRNVRSNGQDWEILPTPAISELYPNNSNDSDFPWHLAKKTILEHLEDVSLLWQVGNRGRDIAHAAGIYKWTDPNISAETVGLATGKRSHIFSQILNVNQGNQGPLVLPDTIEANRSEWISVPELEFYVDFETVSDLSDDFASLPQKGGQPLIFMIGCGHIEDGKWIFRDFTATTLSEPEEVRIIQEWTAHMEAVRARISPKTLSPRLIHWSQAETSTLENAYNSAWQRHNKPDWPHLEWFDFLSKVVREEPVVVRGAMGFGLKAISKALYNHKLIHTSWEDGPTDGLGAMAGAWWCHEESKRLDISMSELPLMNDIVSYNEVDCRVMMDIIRYLRSNH